MSTPAHPILQDPARHPRRFPLDELPVPRTPVRIVGQRPGYEHRYANAGPDCFWELTTDSSSSLD